MAVDASLRSGALELGPHGVLAGALLPSVSSHSEEAVWSLKVKNCTNRSSASYECASMSELILRLGAETIEIDYACEPLC